MDFSDYLTISLSYPPGFPEPINAFLDRVEMRYPQEEPEIVLAFTWASTEAPTGSVAFVFDLDLHATCANPLSLDEAFGVLRDLKIKEGRAFEDLLTDRLREQFIEIAQ